MSERKPTEDPDIYDASLKGTTYRVYRYMYRSGKPVRVNEVQRELNLSSPSVAQYHIKKLIRLGLVREDSEGYVIDKVVFENVIRFRRLSIPFQAAYATFFAASLLILLTVLRPGAVTSSYFFALVALGVALVISLYESFRSLRRLG